MQRTGLSASSLPTPRVLATSSRPPQIAESARGPGRRRIPWAARLRGAERPEQLPRARTPLLIASARRPRSRSSRARHRCAAPARLTWPTPCTASRGILDQVPDGGLEQLGIAAITDSVGSGGLEVQCGGWPSVGRCARTSVAIDTGAAMGRAGRTGRRIRSACASCARPSRPRWPPGPRETPDCRHGGRALPSSNRERTHQVLEVVWTTKAKRRLKALALAARVGNGLDGGPCSAR